MTDKSTFERLCDAICEFKPVATSVHCGDHRNLKAVLDQSRLVWTDDHDWRSQVAATFRGLQVLDDPDLPADVLEFRDGDENAIGRFEDLCVKETV